jgi:hypothetical protein
MKEKSVFDKIYNKESTVNFKKLTSSIAETSAVDVNLSEELVSFKEVSDASLNAYLTAIYNSKNIEDIRIPTALEKSALKEKVLRNRTLAEKIRQELLSIRNDIKDQVKGKTFILDISKSTTLKAASNDVFGGNKQNILYEDYLQLLSLKKQILTNESMDIMEN